MLCFVTGGTGFVGRELVALLRSRGHAVRALVRRTGAVPAGVEEVRGDLGDVPGFAPALAGADAVIHVAARVPPEVTEAEAATVNHGATVALARAARAAGVPAFVFVSSVMAVGFRSIGLVDASTPCLPTEPYGRSKRDAEVDLLALDAPGFRVAIVRPPTVYGPGDTRGNFIAFARAVRRGVFPLPGGGANRMSFCHNRNLAEALLLCAGHPDARGVFHVADERPVTLRETAEIVRDALGTRVFLPSIPLPLMRALVGAAERALAPLGKTPPITTVRLNTISSDFAFDVAALERLGWRAAVPARTGMADAVRGYLAEGRLG